jgi:hypothetical protein
MVTHRKKAMKGGWSSGISIRGALTFGMSASMARKKRGTGPLGGRCLSLVLFLAVFVGFPIHTGAAVGKSYVKELDTPGKYLMHLEGTPYQIGYAMGSLRPGDVVRLVHGEYAVSMLSIVVPLVDGGSRQVEGSLVDGLLRLRACRGPSTSWERTPPTSTASR